jgi:hypothetical protein
MSDNLRRYRAIHDALRQGYPGEPSGNRARHLTTLAASHGEMYEIWYPRVLPECAHHQSGFWFGYDDLLLGHRLPRATVFGE